MMHMSEHARRQAAARSVSPEQMLFAHAHGEPIYQREDRIAYHFGKKELKAAQRAGIKVPSRTLDVAVVVCEAADMVITVFRSKDRHRLANTHRRVQRRLRKDRRY